MFRLGTALFAELAVSPGLMPRPSLSGSPDAYSTPCVPGVAGVDAPAFVERACAASSGNTPSASVAGVDAPAFVERRTSCGTGMSQKAGVAGVDAPAFVERTQKCKVTCWQRRRCRRG